jgi:hypothetical protein
MKFEVLSFITLSRLQRIEAEYNGDTSDDKPSEYTPGMSSHSIRATAMNELDDVSDIKDSWVNNRAGLSMKKIDTKANYTRGTYKSDRSCGLILAGWPTSKDGGKMPHLPHHESRPFQAFVEKMYMAHLPKMSMDVLIMFGKIQVLWSRQYPNLITTATAPPLTTFAAASDLIRWQQQLYDSFVERNGRSFTFASVDPSTDDLHTVVHHIADEVGLVHEKVNVAIARSGEQVQFNASMAHKIDTLCESQDRIEEKQDMILQHLAMRSEVTPSKRQRTDSTVQTTLPGALIHSHAATHAVSAVPVPAFKCITDVIVMWYTCPDHVKKMATETPDQRSTLKKLNKLIAYSKLFMAAGTSINRAGAQVDNVVFARSIHRIAEMVKKNLREFLRSHDIVQFLREHKLFAPSCNQSKKLPLWQTYKNLECLNKNSKLPTPPANITDTIYPHSII